ncbi:MAG TPA: polysaccharide deacetylase family protein [Pyrinomonadaceae bacterium]|jgi:peptidoglycan/xylan/chitin deacetylase (PgdA/CDA1 family)|nr:polysaccharide deacetylase family protein [Pyrinomonadaceae bacterium]
MLSTTHREVAVTFDDVPQYFGQAVVSGLSDMHRKLLGKLVSNNVPAVGFVNEGFSSAEESEGCVADILRMWLDAGFELGNHTYSHLYFYETALPLYQQDVIRGEAISSALLSGQGMRLRYFRYPYLSTGPDLATKAAFEQFLAARRYQVAPVTIDSMEWLFAGVYSQAMADGDQATMRLVADAYVPYMEEVFEFYERLSADVIGREMPQTLMLHATWLNADCFDHLSAMIEGRGYRFITLEQALRHAAYRSADSYIGPVGISWLQRWALTKGGRFRKEPGLPRFMKQFDDCRESGSHYKTV